MKTNARVRRATAGALLVSMSACHTTYPVTSTPTPDTRVLATLTDSGTVVMGGMIGTGALAIEGLVATADANTWDLRLLRVQHREGRTVAWSGEVVRFPRSILTNAAAKELDMKRSVLAGVMIVAGAVAASALFGAVTSDGEDSNPPPPPAARIPVSFLFR